MYEIVPVPRNLRHIIPTETAPRGVVQNARRLNRLVVNKPDRPLSLSNDLLDALVSLNTRLGRRVVRALYYKGFRCRWFCDDNLDLDPDGCITYSPDGDDSAKRQRIKPGRFVRRFLAPWYLKDVTENELREFAEQIQAFALGLQVSVEVVDVDTAYGWKECVFESCMQGEPVSAFYEDIGVWGCVTIFRDSVLAGRAIIWERSGIVPGCCGFVDRIYGDVKVQVLIKKWAHDNNFAHKKKQNSTDVTLVLPSGDDYNLCRPWKCDDSIFLEDRHFFPFLDTYSRYIVGVGLVPNDREDADFFLDRQDGGMNDAV